MSELAEEVGRIDAGHERRLEALAHCMERLPGKRRDVLDRRYLKGESVEQIAIELRKPPNVVAASLYRIRKTLLECIEIRLSAH